MRSLHALLMILRLIASRLIRVKGIQPSRCSEVRALSTYQMVLAHGKIPLELGFLPLAVESALSARIISGVNDCFALKEAWITA